MKEIILAILGSSALSAIISGIVSYLSEKRKEENGSDKLLLMLTALQLHSTGETIVQRGTVTFKELELYNDAYDLYKKKDGNGYVDELKNRISQLPVK